MRFQDATRTDVYDGYRQMNQYGPGFGRVLVLPFEVRNAERTTESGRPRLDIDGMISTVMMDHMDEVIEVGFFENSLEQFLRRGTMRWMHQLGDVQGRWTKVEPVADEGYHAEGYMVHLGTELDERRFAMVEERLVGSASVGFNAEYEEKYGGEDDDGRWHWKENGILMEASLVDIPANEGASIMVAKALGLQFGRAPRLGEEERVLEDLKRLGGAAEALSNIARHWNKGGGAPSAQVLDSLWSPIHTLVEIAKVGRVLSAANRDKVESAISALQALITADDESRSNADGKDEDRSAEYNTTPDDWMVEYGIEPAQPVNYEQLLGELGVEV